MKAACFHSGYRIDINEMSGSKACKPALVCNSYQGVLAMWSSLQQNYEAVFKPLKPLISKELAVFLLHGRVFSQGVFRGCSRFYEHGVFRVFRGVFTVRGVHSL